MGGGSCSSLPQVSACLTTGTEQRFDPETETLIPTIGGGFDVAHTLRADGFDASEDGTGRGTPLVPTIVFDTTQITSAANYSNPKPGDPCHPLTAGGHAPALAFNWQSGGDCRGLEPAETTNALHCGQTPAALSGMAVRRLTPREAERLQGAPDNWTLVPNAKGKPMADGPRYKMIGNSFAVPVIRWIGERIQAAHAHSEAEVARWRGRFRCGLRTRLNDLRRQEN